MAGKGKVGLGEGVGTIATWGEGHDQGSRGLTNPKNVRPRRPPGGGGIVDLGWMDGWRDGRVMMVYNEQRGLTNPWNVWPRRPPRWDSVARVEG